MASKDHETLKLIGQQAAVIGGSYVLSKWIGGKIADKLGKPTSEAGDLETKRAFVSIGIAAGSVFMFDKIENKLIASGLIAGTGLNAVTETLRIPRIKSALPASFQSFLGEDNYSDGLNQYGSQQQILDMVNQKIEEAQVAGYLSGNHGNFENVHSIPVYTVQGETVGSSNDPTFAGETVGSSNDPTFSGEEDEIGEDSDYFGSDLDGDGLL